jgi:recombination protein RecA
LDIAISNRPYGGIPVGRIVEINGLEQSGKSLLCGHILAETQKKDGMAIFIDTESAVDQNFIQAIGVDISKLLYIQADTVEDIFKFMETIIEKIRNSDRKKLVTIVVDSIAQASTKSELEGDYDLSGYGTEKSRLIGQAMRKITNMISEQKISIVFTNQLRMKLNAMPFGDPYITPGGKALPYAASVIMRLSKKGQIKSKINGIDTVIGVKVKAELKKNRVGPPFTSCEFDIFFASGIDNYGSWLKVMKDNNLVKTAGAWYTYINDETGEEIKFQAKEFQEIIESDSELHDQIYRKICDATIRKYVTGTTIDPNDIELEESSD